MTIDADYGKLRGIAGHLFGASPINLDSASARRLANKLAKKVLAAYRAECRELLLKRGLIKRAAIVAADNLCDADD
jgi:hypothetical protein